ncbi:MAG: SDR family oxidoreductase [Acidimicrobiia bacterium]|nr:SDR family oxidoreductase [Acidimicrobiia bacterium]
MDLRLDNKVALVTGGSAGIGMGIAKAFADAGASVMITSRKADKCEAAVAEIGGDTDWTVSNVGEPEQAEACIDRTIERFGALDILVNNAATNPWAGPVIDCDVSRLDKTWQVNLRGPLVWTQLAWRKYMQAHGGCVINIASVGAFSTDRQLGVYNMLKRGLVHLTEQLAAELGPTVRVNCIAPGLVRTDFARILWEGERGDAVAATLPLHLIGEPEDIGGAALWIAANARWMTGETITLDGGEKVKLPATPAELAGDA